MFFTKKQTPNIEVEHQKMYVLYKDPLNLHYAFIAVCVSNV